MRQQRDDCPGVHAEATPPQRECGLDSAKPVLSGQSHAQRAPQHGIRRVVPQPQGQESVWTLCKAAGAEEIKRPGRRLRGRDVTTVLSLAGRPQASHPRPAEIQERFSYAGPASRLRHWHGQLLKGGPRRGPPPPGARALPPPLPLGLGGGRGGE